MKRLFLDANVFLDAFLERTGLFSYSQTILEFADAGKVVIYTSSSIILTVMYFLKKEGVSGEKITETIDNMLSKTSLVSPTEKTFRQGLYAGFDDLEDAVHYHTALQISNLNYFITSNTKDYKKASAFLPVLTPKEFISL